MKCILLRASGDLTARDKRVAKAKREKFDHWNIEGEFDYEYTFELETLEQALKISDGHGFILNPPDDSYYNLPQFVIYDDYVE